MKFGDYLRAFATGWHLAWRVKLLAGSEVVCTVASQLAMQYSVQLVTIIISGLSLHPAARRAQPSGIGAYVYHLLFPQSLGQAVSLFIAATVVYLATSVAVRFVAISSDFWMAAALQSSLHDNLLRENLEYHRRHLYAETSTVILRYANTAQGMLKELAFSPLTRGVPLLTAVLLLLSNLALVSSGAPLPLLAFIVVAIIAVPLTNSWLAKRAEPAIKALRQLDFDVSREFKNSAEMPTEISILGAIDMRNTSFAALLQFARGKRVSAAIQMEMSRQVATLAPNVVQAVVLTYCVVETVAHGNLAATGAILGVYYFVPQVMSPIQQIVQFVNMIQVSWPQIEPVLDLYDDVPDAASAGVGDTREGPREPLAISLRDVGLTVASAGNATKSLLSGVTAEIAPGACVGIVGKSGSGKTTILLCLARLLRPETGQILLGNRPVNDFSENELRHRVSILSQFPLVIDATLRENFRLALPSISDKEIQALCEEVGVWDAIVAATHDLADPLSVNLSMEANQDRLSGGQRRLLLLARALAREPDLILYDEPTTGVDLESQSAILAAVSKRKPRSTQVIVDHNVEFLSAACETVICVEEGRITVMGSPRALAESGDENLYRELSRARQQMSA